MEDANNKSVRFNALTGEKFEKVAVKLGRNKRLIFMQMVDYFYRSKKDPLDVNDELLKNTLLKNHRDYIGFIKTQETDLLIPTKREVDRMIQSQKKLLDYFNSHVIKHNESLLNNQQVQQNKFSKSDEIMSLIIAKLDTREKLKNKFIYIVENYIKARESFTMMTSGREKEELINKTMQQINQL
ncbi:MAG: hypothetical protein H7096_01335 [Flavobacterium sp.]|nr:hypothetical protein [Pedobacter sp.]